MILWVDADNVGASDSGDRTAISNSATPAKTINHACLVAVAGDTVKVIPAVNADPTNTTDPRFYGPVASNVYGFPFQLLAHNITVEGVVTGGVTPRWQGLNVQDLVGWTIRNFQVGYDLGTGDDYNFNSTLIGPVGFTAENIFFTSGAYQLLGPSGDISFNNCIINSKVRPTPADFLEGNGFRIASYDPYPIDPTCNIEFHGCTFETIQGEDGIQAAFGGNIIVEDCTFNDILQTSTLHTDAIQVFGVNLLRVARCTFGYTAAVDSMIIASDGFLETLELENNLFIGWPGSGFLTQMSGVAAATVRHNTWVNSGFAGLRFFSKPANVRDSYNMQIYNNVIDHIEIDIPTSGPGVVWNQHDNIIGTGAPIMSTDVAAFQEFGTSVDTTYELSNSPTNSVGIDRAAVSDLVLDRLGRTRKGVAPDCGCHESNPAVLVTTDPRAPILVSFTPTGVNIPLNPVIQVVYHPLPGTTIDPATVAGAITLTDPYGYTIPGTTSASGNVVSFHFVGALYYGVFYGLQISGPVADTDGNLIAGPTSWNFRTIGVGGPLVHLIGDILPWVPVESEGVIPSNDELLLNLSIEPGEQSTGYITPDDIATIVDGLMQRLHFNQRIVVTDPGAPAPDPTKYTDGQIWVELLIGTPNSQLHLLNGGAWDLMVLGA